MQPSAMQDTGLLPCFIGIDQLVSKPQFQAKIETSRFLREERVWSGFGDDIVDSMRDNLSSPGWVGFKQRAVERNSGLSGLLLQRKGGGQPGNTATDNYDCAWSSHDGVESEDSCAAKTSPNVSRIAEESFNIGMRSSCRPLLSASCLSSMSISKSVST